MQTPESPPVIARQQYDHARRERMEAEFIGGPFDGSRLVLDIVRDGPNDFRVLEAGYRGPPRPRPRRRKKR